MKIALGSDKSGYNAKEAVKAWLEQEGYEFDDLGTVDPENALPYYQVAQTVAPRVADGSYDRAILLCGTGAGRSSPPLTAPWRGCGGSWRPCGES